MPDLRKTFKKNSRFTSYVLLSINTLVWGAALIVVKPAFSVTTPIRFLFYRYFFAVILSLPILWHYLPKLKKKTQTILKITLLELLGTTTALTLLYMGLNLTTAIEASLIITTTPIFVILAGVIFLKEREEKHELLGLLIAFTGTVALVSLPLINGGAQNQGLSLTGNLLIIGQNIVNAIYLILAKKHYHRLPKLLVVSISFYVGLLSFFILSLLEANGSVFSLATSVMSDFNFTSVWVASLYMALFGSIIGLTTYIKGQDNIEASEASLFTYLQPLVYIPLGIILLQEKFNVWQGVSLLLILLGVVIAEKRSKKSRN